MAVRQHVESEGWPSLPLEEWQPTYATLHMWLQIVGKTRLALAPMENHWWQVALYVTPRGLTTSLIPYGTGPSRSRSIFSITSSPSAPVTAHGAFRSGRDRWPTSTAEYMPQCRRARHRGRNPSRSRRGRDAIPFPRIGSMRRTIRTPPIAAGGSWCRPTGVEAIPRPLSSARRARCISSGGASTSRSPASPAGARRSIRAASRTARIT